MSHRYRPVGRLDPTALLTALAAVTEHLGLLATASTTYNEPYNLARRFASIDHHQRGRAGWTSSPRPAVTRRRTSASTTCPGTGIVTNVPASVSTSAGRSKTAGRTISSSATSSAACSRTRARSTFSGTPEQVADTLQEWFSSAAADGFNVMPPLLPSGLEEVVEHVVPRLRRRGLFRSEYTGSTLREHYGLARPINQFTARARTALSAG